MTMTVSIPEVRQVSTNQVVLILGLSTILMTGVVVLAISGQDVGAILSAVLSVFVVAAGIFGVNLKNTLDQVKDISNGRLTEAIDRSEALLRKNEILNDKLTAMAMLVAPPPKEEDH